MIQYCEHHRQPLPLANRQMEMFCFNEQQQRLLNSPGRPVAFVHGAITGNQIHSQRPSYINALLIQSRGLPLVQPCLACQQGQRRPFPDCARVPGHFGGACANCKWRDAASRCSVRDASGLPPSTRQTRSWPVPRARLPPASSTNGASYDTAIILDHDDGQPQGQQDVMDLTSDVVDLTTEEESPSSPRALTYGRDWEWA